MFKRAPEYRLVESKKPLPVQPFTADLAEQLKTLQHNPAFQYLLARFARIQSEYIRELTSDFNASQDKIRFLQAGISVAGFLQQEIDRLTKTPDRPSYTPSDEDLELFRKAQSSLEIIG